MRCANCNCKGTKRKILRIFRHRTFSIILCERCVMKPLVNDDEQEYRICAVATEAFRYLVAA